MNLPVLYKKTSTGAIATWNIDVSGSTIVTRHGQLDGKIQETRDEVREGKNLGKTNATTAIEQAEKEAVAKWEKRIKRHGYVESLTRAEAGETDADGGIQPMLAKVYEDCIKKVKWPWLIQRKYDGVRCTTVYDDGDVTLWSRKREQMVCVPHIIEAVAKIWAGPGYHVLDGELFKPGWSMQKIASFARQKKTPKPGYEQLEYHVYDYPCDGYDNLERDALLLHLPIIPPLVRVPTYTAHDYEEAVKYHDEWVRDGYEGAILRNPQGMYEEGKRSSNLLKLKRFMSDEFEIVSVHEGRGKFEGLAIFTCKTKEGKLFDCNAPGTFEERQELLKRADECVGKQLTVKFFGWTDDNYPRFPVGCAIRDYE